MWSNKDQGRAAVRRRQTLTSWQPVLRAWAVCVFLTIGQTITPPTARSAPNEVYNDVGWPPRTSPSAARPPHPMPASAPSATPHPTPAQPAIPGRHPVPSAGFNPDTRSPVEAMLEQQLQANESGSEAPIKLNPKFEPADPYFTHLSFEIVGLPQIQEAGPYRDTSEDDEAEGSPQFREGYFLIKDMAVESLSLKVGRQRLKDHREWLFDEQLDAVKIIYDQGPLSAEFSVSSLLIGSPHDDEQIVNYILYTTYRYEDQDRISLFMVGRDDRGLPNRDPIHLGLSWEGQPHRHTGLWLDAAMLVGREKHRQLLSFGLDAGVVQRIQHPLKPALTFGFAFGSGDADTGDDTDNNFQQTDLHDNHAAFEGHTGFQYYGQVLDPELSNIMIFTAGAGIAPSPAFSMDLVYHYYTLVELADQLRDARFIANPSGDDKDLGHEVDLIFGLWLERNISATVSTGVFFPGAAYPGHAAAIGADLRVQIAF